MAIHKLREMTRTHGDLVHEFDTDVEASVAEANRLFRRLTGIDFDPANDLTQADLDAGETTHKGMLAYSKGEGGASNQKVTSFDPTVRETVFTPHLVGG